MVRMLEQGSGFLKRVGWGWHAAILLLIVVVLLHLFVLHGSETRSEYVQVGDQFVKLTTKIRFRRGLAADHAGVRIDRYDYTFIVTLEFPDGRKIGFDTDTWPAAIWNLEGQLYYVGWGYGIPGMYRTAKVQADGTLVPISKKDLPAGSRPWNVGRLSEERQKSEEGSYQLRAH